MSKLLVVDDEDHIRKLYKDFFSREGYNVITVATGEEALAAADNEGLDLIVLDIELEEESGLNVMKQLKERHPELPIVLNTAYSTYKSDFHTWIADAYVMKSSDLQPLKNKIKELVFT
jgi:DNA-binding response OmpR family regulator